MPSLQLLAFSLQYLPAVALRAQVGLPTVALSSVGGSPRLSRAKPKEVPTQERRGPEASGNVGVEGSAFSRHSGRA
jgi:hypothetical protein